MLSKIVLACAFTLGLAMPALADSSSCSEPIAPAAVDGNTATLKQMKDAVADVKEFLKASDDYQACLVSDLAQQQRDAKKNKKDFDPAITSAATAKVDANQALKEKVGGEYNAAVVAYKAKHP
jgi:hypothetical protein